VKAHLYAEGRQACLGLGPTKSRSARLPESAEKWLRATGMIPERMPAAPAGRFAEGQGVPHLTRSAV